MKINGNPYLKSASGLEIKDWIWYNAHSNTKYSKVAKSLMNKFNIDDDKNYMIVHCIDKTRIIEVEKRDVEYKIPCDD